MLMAWILERDKNNGRFELCSIYAFVYIWTDVVKCYVNLRYLDSTDSQNNRLEMSILFQ